MQVLLLFQCFTNDELRHREVKELVQVTYKSSDLSSEVGGNRQHILNYFKE